MGAKRYRQQLLDQIARAYEEWENSHWDDRSATIDDFIRDLKGTKLEITRNAFYMFKRNGWMALDDDPGPSVTGFADRLAAVEDELSELKHELTALRARLAAVETAPAKRRSGASVASSKADGRGTPRRHPSRLS